MTEFFNMAINEYGVAVGVSCYVLLWIVSVMYILLKNNEEKWKKTMMVVGTLLILLLIIFNPLYFFLITKISDYTYYRLYWTLPADLLIGYTVVDIVRREFGIKKYIFMICIVLYLVIGGKPIHSTFGIKHYDNLYKVSPQQIAVTDAIINDKNSENKRALVSAKGTQFLKSYDSRINLYECGIGRIAPQEVIKYMEDKKCDYAVINKKEDAYMGKYESAGLLKLLDVDDFTVYVKVY